MQGQATCEKEYQELEMLVASLGVGQRNASNRQKGVSVKSDLSYGQRSNTYEDCMSVKSEMDNSMAEKEDPSEVSFRHFLDHQDERYDDNRQKKSKLKKHEMLNEPGVSEVKANPSNDEIKVERESDESDPELENEDEEGGHNNPMGDIDSARWSNKFAKTHEVSHSVSSLIFYSLSS